MCDRSCDMAGVESRRCAAAGATQRRTEKTSHVSKNVASPREIWNAAS